VGFCEHDNEPSGLKKNKVSQLAERLFAYQGLYSREFVKKYYLKVTGHRCRHSSI
jgi:hypothetical protein